MGYTKQTWNPVDHISSKKLNHIESGIFDNKLLIDIGHFPEKTASLSPNVDDDYYYEFLLPSYVIDDHDFWWSDFNYPCILDAFTIHLGSTVINIPQSVIHNSWTDFNFQTDDNNVTRVVLNNYNSEWYLIIRTDTNLGNKQITVESIPVQMVSQEFFNAWQLAVALE